MIANLKEIHRQDKIHMNIRSKAYFLKNKFEVALFDLESIESIPNGGSYDCNTRYIRNEKGRYTKNDVEPLRKYQHYYNKGLYYEMDELPGKYVDIKYKRSSNVRALAFLIIQILNPRATQTLMKDMRDQHSVYFSNYCTEITNDKILLCVIFRELLEKMLSVSLNDEETIENYHDEFLANVESLLVKGSSGVKPKLSDNEESNLGEKASEIEHIIKELKTNYEDYFKERVKAKWQSCKINSIYEFGNKHSLSFLSALADIEKIHVIENSMIFKRKI